MSCLVLDPRTVCVGSGDIKHIMPAHPIVACKHIAGKQ